MRDDYIVLVGGAPLNEEFGKAVGADAYCRDAAVAAETAQALVMAKRAAATALSVRGVDRMAELTVIQWRDIPRRSWRAPGRRRAPERCCRTGSRKRSTRRPWRRADRLRRLPEQMRKDTRACGDDLEAEVDAEPRDRSRAWDSAIRAGRSLGRDRRGGPIGGGGRGAA